jgi:hypothetical protein
MPCCHEDASVRAFVKYRAIELRWNFIPKTLGRCSTPCPAAAAAAIGGDCCHDLGRILDGDNIVLRDSADPYVPGLVRSDGTPIQRLKPVLGRAHQNYRSGSRRRDRRRQRAEPLAARDWDCGASRLDS